MLNTYRLEQSIHRRIAAQEIVGLALALVQGTEVTYARGFGTTSVEDGGLAVTPHTLFCVGSITKSLTGTLVMRLVEQGKLDLDTPVVDYLPGFAFSDASLGRRVTLRHVLSHSTGLPNAGKDFGPRDPDALRQFVWDEIPRYGFVAEPGAVHLYSNTIFVLAGYLAEVVTGRYYEQLMRELVFAPLGMERATFDRTVAMTYPVALAHERGADGALRVKHRFTDNVSGNPAGFGLASTLDLANFALAHLNAGRFDDWPFLAPESIAQMHAPQVETYLRGGDAGYGLAFYVGAHKGAHQVSHGGMLESYWCNLSVFPDAGVGVVLQCNCGDERVLMGVLNDVFDGLLGRRGTEAPQAPAVDDRSRWPLLLGTYLSMGAGLATVEEVDNRLVLNQSGTARPLTAVGNDRYLMGKAPVAFLPSGSGPSEYLVVGGEPYRRTSIDPAFAPDPARWLAYEGVYEEIPDNPYPVRVRVAGERLLVHQDGEEAVCTPLSDTRFVGERGVIDFELPDGGGTPVLVVGQASRLRRRPAAPSAQ